VAICYLFLGDEAMTATIRTITDERGRHAVIVTLDGECRVFFRHDTASVAGAAYNNLRRDIARHGESVIDFVALPVANFRLTKAGKSMLV
jgi:hypothetical protein